MNGFFVYQDKKGRCRGVAVVQRWQLVEVQLTFLVKNVLGYVRILTQFPS